MNLNDIDPAELIEFAKAYCDLGAAVQRQLERLLSGGEENFASLNPNAVAMIGDSSVMMEIDAIADACMEYEQWQNDHSEDDEE